MAGWVYIQSPIKGSFIKYIFNKKVWTSGSARVDYYFWFFNSLIKVILIGPFIKAHLYLAQDIADLSHRFIASSPNMSQSLAIVLYTICLFLVNDFLSYFVHLLLHKIPFLWRIHKTHHSATVLNPFTQYRIHPLELILHQGRYIISFALVTGLFEYLSNGQINLIAVLGVNVLGFAFRAIGSNLRHSHVKFKYPEAIEKIFMSPYQHQIHHSDKEEHFDKNLGSALSIWDYLGKTLLTSKQIKRLNFGLGKESKKKSGSFLENLKL